MLIKRGGHKKPSVGEKSLSYHYSSINKPPMMKSVLSDICHFSATCNCFSGEKNFNITVACPALDQRGI